jgi:hypothetical protein
MHKIGTTSTASGKGNGNAAFGRLMAEELFKSMAAGNTLHRFAKVSDLEAKTERET